MTVYQVEEIAQKDNFAFTIKWTDGKIVDYRLSDIQKMCPCASCRDEATGQQKVDPLTIDETVKAKRIASVGRYALRVDFSNGCSSGIYSFDDLRNNFL